MANLLAIPQISGIDALLALLTSPQELAKTLETLRAMIDEINARMGDIKTKEQADDYAARAAQALLEANATLTKAQADAAELEAAAAMVSRETAEARDAVAVDRAKLDDDQRAFASTQSAGIAAIEKQATQQAVAASALAAREAKLSNAEAALAIDKAAFTERLRKLGEGL